MRLGLISLSAESPAGNKPAAMLPLFDSNILSRQVQSVRQMGAEKIIFLSPTMHSELLQYADNLKNHDIKIDIARNALDLQDYVSQGDDLIFLGDGVFPDHSIEQKIQDQSEELIYVVANADNYDNFERIDLTHRWLGIALLKSERLAEIADIPDDWDIGSALLRTAVQAESARALVSDTDMLDDAVSQLLNSEASDAYAKRQLGAIKLPKQNVFDRFLLWPSMRKLIPVLWKSPSAKNYSGFASLGAATVAVTLGLLGWPAVALGLLFAGSIALALHHRISILSARSRRVDLLSLCFHLLAATVLTVAVVNLASPESMSGDITILLLLFGNLWIIFTQPENKRLNPIIPDTSLILLVLLLAAAFGVFSTGLYLVTLFCLVYLILAQRGGSAEDSRPDPLQ
ncbi:hypothetical protein [Parasphingorhabdus cellanae]|uniref:Uncharacterized protein n=1 Tax=Parasphingorhabdus cellanae TaxID=2806553 RepID=A0ABX7T3D2_9SPHN|nr:hypothetical protein [Parasphingorhabdus cellanae]QTD56076.1 hypothetical protein J4G78_00225 [Parasphingorhabdus cellanae]